MNKVLAGFGLAGALALGFVYGSNAFSTPTAPVQTQEEERVAAVASPEIQSPWIKFGGITTYNVVQPFQQATTTICSIPNPYSATSTFTGIMANFSTGTSTAAVVVFATSTNAYATSSTDRIFDRDTTITGGTQPTITYRPAGPNDNIVAANESIIVQAANPGQSGFKFGGSCYATFQRIQN